MTPSIPTAQAVGRTDQAPKIEELVANATAAFPVDLVAARGVPIDPQATADLKGDTDRLEKLEEILDLEEGASVADVAVRGVNVSFVVFDAEGGDHRGFVPLTALGSGSKADKAVQRGVQQASGRHSGQPTGGTADPDPTSNASGEGTGGTPTTPDGAGTGADAGTGDDDPKAEAPEGYAALNVTEASKYVTEADEEEARAALAFERTGRDEGPRKGVIDAGDKRFPPQS